MTHQVAIFSHYYRNGNTQQDDNLAAIQVITIRPIIKMFVPCGKIRFLLRRLLTILPFLVITMSLLIIKFVVSFWFFKLELHICNKFFRAKARKLFIKYRHRKEEKIVSFKMKCWIINCKDVTNYNMGMKKNCYIIQLRLSLE